MADRYQDTPCTTVISNSYDTHGTVTRASIAHLTPAQLLDLFKPSGLFADMDSWFRTAFEMRACGTKRNGFYDWVTSSTRNVSSLLSFEKIDRGPSLLKPFILGKQESVINKDFWAITAGWAQAAYTAEVTGPLTAEQLALGAAGDRVIRVVTRYGMDLDAKWFVDRDRILIFGRANGIATRGQWKVMASAVATDLSYIDVVLKTENAGSTTPYDAAPTEGVLIPLGNNVNDFESWCQNRPTVDPRKRVPFYYQAMRRTRRVDSEYKKVFARLMESNKYFQEFGDLDLAQRNAQDEAEYQRRWLNTFLFGKKISANQTLANWQNLDQILTVTGANMDPGLGGKLVAYRANMEGVYEQLRRCGRVKDLQNNALNFHELLDELYNIIRARKTLGKPTTDIDIFTDTDTAGRLETAVINYYKAEYGDIVRVNADNGFKKGSNEYGFSWTSFHAKKPRGVTINIVTHETFDDLASAFEAESIGSSGRFMLILDIGKPGAGGGTIYPGHVASNRKVRTIGELENLAKLDPTFACTMEHITEEITLISETTTAIVECPAVSLWIENFSDAVPVTTGKTVSYSNLY